MLLGYARVSTDDQDLTLQRDALTHVGCERIFEDYASGATAERPGLHAVLQYARSGDSLVVWRLDRLSRSLSDLIAVVTRLEQHGIGFRSVQEAIDTTSSTGKLVFHLFGALAEFERALIRERTNAGLQAARARGRVGGRPKALTADQQQVVVQLYHERQYTVSRICQMFSISKPTLYKYLASAASASSETSDA